MIEEKVIPGRDNTIDLLFTADNIAEDLSTVTKVVLKDENEVLDDISSEDHPTWFNWTNVGGVIGRMEIKLGASLDLVADTRHIFRIILFDPVNTNGIFWDRMMIKVI
jgi:hypothetical protein